MSSRDLLLECDKNADTSIFDAKLQELNDVLAKLREEAVDGYRPHVIFNQEPVSIVADGSTR